MDNQIFGAKKQIARGSVNHYGATKDMRKPANYQEEENQANTT